MGKRKKEVKQTPSLFDRARNELFSQIKHCGVLKATEDQKDVWFKDTMEYMAKQYPGVTEEQLAELNELGRRFCEPVRSHGVQSAQLAEGSS